jgi:phosphoadenosine phosphosulfate reductase
MSPTFSTQAPPALAGAAPDPPDPPSVTGLPSAKGIPSAKGMPSAAPASAQGGDDSAPDLDLTAARAHLDPLPAEARLAWALATFGEQFCLTTSFGIQSAVLLHMASRLGPGPGGNGVPVIWVDTGYLPEETYRYAADLCERLPVNLQVAQADISPARMEALYGKLWETGSVDDLSLYNQMRKVEPLDRAFQQRGIRCWASGVRGRQTDHRRTMSTLDPVRGLLSLRPLLSWSSKDIYYYMETHQLPQHPLFAKGYSTVGDWHSSSADDGTVSGRATRFGGLKQECGIHLPGLMGEGI